MLAAILSLGLAYAASAEDKVEPKGKSAEKIKKLLTQRRDLLKEALDAYWRAYSYGAGSIDAVAQASKDLLRAELDVAATPKERLAAHEAHLELMRKVEKAALEGVKKGGISKAGGLRAQADRIEAEVGWLKAGGEEKKDRKDK